MTHAEDDQRITDLDERIAAAAAQVREQRERLRQAALRHKEVQARASARTDRVDDWVRRRPTDGPRVPSHVPEDLAPASRRGAADVDVALDALAGMSLAEHTLSSVMDIVTRLVQQAVPEAEEVSVSVLDGRRASSVAFSGPRALSVDERQYAHERGPCLASAEAGEVVEVPDIVDDDRWPAFRAAALVQGLRSCLSVPVPLQREVTAVINLYSSRPHGFGEDDREIALAMAAYTGVALANIHLHEAEAATARQLEEAMRSRAVIEQAKGIVMAERRCTPDQAFEILVRLSQETNRKLRDVAAVLVARAWQRA